MFIFESHFQVRKVFFKISIRRRGDRFKILIIRNFVEVVKEVERSLLSREPDSDEWLEKSVTYRRAWTMVAEAKATKPSYFAKVTWPKWADDCVNKSLELERQELENSHVVKEMLELAGDGWEAAVRVPTKSVRIINELLTFESRVSLFWLIVCFQFSSGNG